MSFGDKELPAPKAIKTVIKVDIKQWKRGNADIVEIFESKAKGLFKRIKAKQMITRLYKIKT